MNEALTYATIPYWNESDFMIVCCSLFLAGLLIYDTIKNYKEKKKLDTIGWIGIGMIVFFTAVAVSCTSNINKNSHWVYVFNEEEIYLCDLSGTNKCSDKNLIASTEFSELTPYFKYRRGSKPSRNSYVLRLKLENGTDFLYLKSDTLTYLIEDYLPIHEKNPNLLKRTVVSYGSEKKFKTFLDKLNE